MKQHNILSKSILLLIFCGIFFNSFLVAQRKTEKESTLFGFGAIYNFQTQGVALDLRAKIPVYKNTYIVPRFSYFPGLNNIHELYFGADANYHLYRYKNMIPYVHLGGYYDRWINSDDFVSKKAKLNNFVFEGGAGVVFDFNCLNPFLEYRYDTKWLEGSLEAGLYLRFGKCFKKKQKIRCPAFS
ncbi:MAG: hypothetical protein BWY70_00488 [Bacteroidetes bacterium ADurb.Bin408]|nr:MAG: hypothetical protein BWY70_00488 [Bacteroidetes bacterium ADurb.Bin408]